MLKFKNLIITAFLLMLPFAVAQGAQHDFDITTADANTGITYRAAVNAALQALATLSSGATAPASPYPYQLWADITTGNLKIRNAANTAWVTLWNLSTAPIASVSIRTIVADGVYAPPDGLVYAIVEVIGGGGGGGGSTAGNGSGGGSGGGYSRKLLSAASIGASQAVAIGVGGTGGAVGVGGTGGGTTSFGVLLSATGGGPGPSGGGMSGLPGGGGGGDVNANGEYGHQFNGNSGGNGGSSFLGGGGSGGGSTLPGVVGQSYGAGGGGGGNSAVGGNGVQGVVIITEFKSR